MKTYALAAVAVFLILLGVKIYSFKVDSKIKSQITQSRESVLDSGKANEELQALAKVEPQNVERTLAHLSETGEEEDFANKIGQLDQLSLELEQAILATGDNFEVIDHLKNKIAKLKDAGSMSLSNIEEWDKELIYYLIIEERMTLEEINQLASPGDLNMTDSEWEKMASLSHSSGFRRKILEFKEVKPDFIDENIEALSTGENQEQLIEEIWGSEE